MQKNINFLLHIIIRIISLLSIIVKISYTKKSQKSLFQVDNLILSRNVIYTNIVVLNVLKHFKISQGWVVQVKSTLFLAQDKKSGRSYPDGWRHLLFKKITKIAEFYRARHWAVLGKNTARAFKGICKRECSSSSHFPPTESARTSLYLFPWCAAHTESCLKMCVSEVVHCSTTVLLLRSTLSIA